MPKKIQIWGKSQLNLRRKYDFFKKKVAFGQSDVPFLMGEKNGFTEWVLYCIILMS